MIIPSTFSAVWSLPGIVLRVARPKPVATSTEQIVIETVCAYFKTTPIRLKDDNSKHDVSYHRQILTYLLYTYTPYRMIDIAKYLQRERTSMTYARNKVRDMLSAKFDNEYKADVKAIIESIPPFISH